MTISPLVTGPKPRKMICPEDVRLFTALKSSSAAFAASPMLVVPKPVMPAVRSACSDTASSYKRTGTCVKRETARKPFMAFKAVSLTLPRPPEYSTPHSKQATTSPMANSAQPR